MLWAKDVGRFFRLERRRSLLLWAKMGFYAARRTATGCNTSWICRCLRLFIGCVGAFVHHRGRGKAGLEFLFVIRVTYMGTMIIDTWGYLSGFYVIMREKCPEH